MKEKLSTFIKQHKLWSLAILLVVLGILLPENVLIVIFVFSFIAVLVLPVMFIFNKFNKNHTSKYSLKDLTKYILIVFGVCTVFVSAKAQQVPDHDEIATSHTSKRSNKTTKTSHKKETHKSTTIKNHSITHSEDKEFWKLDGQDFAKDLRTNLPKKYSGAVVAKATSNGPEDIEVTMYQSAVRQYSDQETQLMGQAIVQDVGVIFRRHMPYINKMNLADITILDQEGNAIGTGNTDGDYQPAD